MKERQPAKSDSKEKRAAIHVLSKVYRKPAEAFDFEIRDAASEPPWQLPEYARLNATFEDRVIGWLISRDVAPGETEILHVFTQPPFRRSGVAKRLIDRLLQTRPGSVFLEVRESNDAARKLYAGVGFLQIGSRKEYYRDPVETAIVMKFHS